MNYLKELENLKLAHIKWAAFKEDKNAQKIFMEKYNMGRFKLLSIINNNINNIRKKEYILSQMENLRRQEQSFLSKHSGRLLKDKDEYNFGGSFRYYDYGFGWIKFKSKEMLVGLNNKIYLFKEPKDMDFIFTLFKKRKELNYDLTTVGTIYDLEEF